MRLFGFPVATAGRSEILAWLLERLTQRLPTLVVTPNAEIMLLAERSPDARAVLQQGDLFVPDGIGLVKAAGMLHAVSLERYPGIELAQDLMSRLALSGGRVYLLGAEPGVAEQAASRLTELYPGLTIAGFRDGYFGAEEAPAIAEGIRAARADLLLAGMGCPRQEGFISQFRTVMAVPLMLGIGGALEVWSGRKRRAPRWVQSMHLEWLYRALQDPARLGRTFSLLRFFGLVLAEKRRLSASGEGAGR
ncbi:WecB/TagA/CpsF family glycosyltransferase [bacterium]|nr:WecB/TagA/CpsF family glycosyltransferase [bacterium]